MVTWLAPRWSYSYAGRRLIRMPIRHILAQHLLGLAPRHPWILNSGAARAICIECAALYARYKQLGFADAQLRLIGHPVDDALHAGLATRDSTRELLEQSLGLGRERPLLVVAFPPDQYGAADISGYEWPHFKAMCEGWKRALDPLA